MGGKARASSTVVAVVVAVINFVTKTGLIRCDPNGCMFWLHSTHIASESANAFILNGTILPELVYILIKTEAKTITSLLRTLFSS